MPDWLAHRAAVLPETEAVECSGASLTFRDLNERVIGLAGALRAHGVGPGDRVAVLAPNSLELVEAIHAVPRAGAILVPLNTRLSADELAWQLTDADPALLLCTDGTREQATAAALAAGRAVPLTMPLPAASAGDLCDVHEPADVHSIIYTSGTTGRPKGAMLTFGNFWASAAGSAFNLGVMPGDRWLACMPLFHVGGLSIILRSAIYGTTAVVHETFDEARVAASLHDGGITHLSVVSSMLQRVLDCDGRASPPALRVVLVGGGPVAPLLLTRALERGFPVIQTYGLSEAASQVATLSPADARSHVGSAGKPLLVTGLRVDAPTGEAGEILVSGPTVTPGYWRNPEATGRGIRDGWLHTGDVGHLDHDGFLYVLDRRDDLIISGGENVYPAEVEAALLAFPGVAEAAVVGLPDERWGQRPVAVVVASTVDSEALTAFLRARLAAYKLPARIEFVAELPRTASGKVQRHLVRSRLLGEAG